MIEFTGKSLKSGRTRQSKKAKREGGGEEGSSQGMEKLGSHAEQSLEEIVYKVRLR